MTRKTVLVVEDDELLLLSIRKSLELRGFAVHGAGNVADARTAVEKLGEALDVSVYDMRLEDPAARGVTGADLALETWHQMREWPPEFIFHSAFGDVAYYRTALKVGVAAYLEKANVEVDVYNLIRHVRVLALRRALNVARPGALQRIKEIVQRASDTSSAVEAFCKQVMAPEFEACLGSPFAVLVSDAQGTRVCGATLDLSAVSGDVLETVQALAHSKGGANDPFVVDGAKLNQLLAGASTVPNTIDGATVVPLAFEQTIRIATIIKPPSRSQDALAETGEHLGRILAQFIRPVVLGQVLRLMTVLAEAEDRRHQAEERERTAIQVASRFCLLVAHRQEEAIQAATDLDGLLGHEHVLALLRDLTDELKEEGTLFSELAYQSERGAPAAWPPAADAADTSSAAAVVREAWTRVDRFAGIADVLNVVGDVQLPPCVRFVSRVVATLLRWMVHRMESEQLDPAAQRITVRCEERADGVILRFEDRTRRIPKLVRDSMFEPFVHAVITPSTARYRDGRRLYLALYVAREALKADHGVIEDKTDELAGTVGNCFMIRFPRPAPDARTPDVSSQ